LLALFVAGTSLGIAFRSSRCGRRRCWPAGERPVTGRRKFGAWSEVSRPDRVQRCRLVVSRSPWRVRRRGDAFCEACERPPDWAGHRAVPVPFTLPQCFFVRGMTVGARGLRNAAASARTSGGLAAVGSAGDHGRMARLCERFVDPHSPPSFARGPQLVGVAIAVSGGYPPPRSLRLASLVISGLRP